MRWRRRSTASLPACAIPGEDLVNSNAGSAGALARRDPTRNLLFGRYSCESFSRCALIAGEGARAPAERLSRFFGQAAQALYQLIKNILLTVLQARCIKAHT